MPQDYYADLELSPTADVQEIKKQYRKLALKYHPDRNPGREQEVNAQFLAIQKAHDVLTDPQQRAKFDATRTRSGGTSRYPAASGVRGNPWSDIGQQFPTPPRRNQPARPTGSGSGADRWNSRFSSGVPPTARQKPSASSETRKNAAQAFANMRPKSQAKPGGGSSTGASATPPPMPPRSESARQRQQASFGTKKAGFQPRTSAYGDEPPVTNSNYTTRPDPGRTQYKPAEPPRQSPTKPAPRMPDPLSQFREYASADDGRQRSPYATHTGEKTNPFDVNSGRQATGRETSSQQPASGGRPKTSATQPSDVEPGPRKSATHEYAGAQDSPSTGEGSSTERPKKTPSKRHGASREKPTIFTIPDDEEVPKATPGQKFSRSSIDGINTSFVNDGDGTAWQFNAGGDSTPVKETPPSFTGTESANTSSAPPAPESSEGSGHKTQADGTFNADGWNDKFGPQTFVPPSRTGSSASPSKGGRTNSKKTRPARRTSGDDGQSAILIEDSSDEETFTWRGRQSQAKTATAESPQAMDIDMDPPPSETTTEAPKDNGARNIPVEPSRPEWRSGDFGGVNGKTSKLPEEQAEPVAQNLGGSEDSEEFKASFADLKNVEPFSRQEAAGLKSFSDLKDSLPFESKASGEVHIEDKSSGPQPLDFPSPPQAPRPPLTMGIPNLKTNVPTWDKYAQEFENYERLWDIFNGQVTKHFAARKSQISLLREEKGYMFLRARGDADLDEYLKTVLQDRDVRKRWDEACDEHEVRLQEFIACKEKMKGDSVLTS